MRKLTAAVAILLTLTMFAGCARQPKTKTSSKIIKSYFKKYGKKYPNTIYHKGAVTQVEVTSQQEIHKGMVAVESFITLKDGGVQRVYATLERGPFGWKFVSWEAETPPVE